MVEVGAAIVLAAVGTAVVWKGSGWLEDAADRLALGYGLPAAVQGAIVAAAGSSMPELVSVLVSTLVHGEFELGVGAIVGSAVFNLLVIPAIAVLIDDGLATTRDLVYKEALFYMLAVATLLLTFSLAVVYYPSDAGTLGGTVTRPLALFPLGLYAFYVFTQYLDVADHEAEPDDEVDLARNWLRFGVGLALIVVGVEALVRAAIDLGDAFGTPTFLWGMTVVAAGSSLPDAFVSVAAARAERPTVTLANVLGSNVFDLLVAVPAGVLVAGALTIEFSHVAPMMGFLVLATVVVLAGMRTDMRLSRREAWVLLALYAGFVAWLVLESVGATSVIRT
jgi:cation:H+ antiporter